MDSDELRDLLASVGGERQANKDGKNDGEIAAPWDEIDRRPRRMMRPVRVRATPGGTVDFRIISYSFYNSFNYSAFASNGREPLRMSLGITSPNGGEGKTTTACNLATALSMGLGSRTIVVDLNLTKPRIHGVFGIPKGPGLAEAMVGDDICIAPTHLENLYVLPVGNVSILSPGKFSTFREILASLFKEFEFVIVDMPSAGARGFPTLIANQLNGLLVVLRAKVTRRKEIDRVFRKVSEDKVLGFVINGVQDDDL